MRALSADVVIVGGGLAGMTLALGLGKVGISSALIDRDDPKKQLAQKHDRRTTAISYASHLVLQQAGVWQDIVAQSQPITDILVTDAGAPKNISRMAQPLLGRALQMSLGFSAEHEGQGQPFGWIVENRLLRQVLYNAVIKNKRNIDYRTSAEAKSFTAVTSGVTVLLKNGQKIKAPLLLGADGRQSAVRAWLGIPVKSWPYHQTAIVFNIRHAKAHHGVALEHFTAAGPFAVLPMTADGKNAQHRSSVVWTVESKDAAALMSLPPEDFDARVQELSGLRLGAVQAMTPPMAYPLQLMHARRYIGPRTALLAEAAHVIHPIAGQGLNLSMRDIFALTKILQRAKSLGLDLGSSAILAEYESQRRSDTMAMAIFTDMLNKLFANNLQSVKVLRGLGMGGIHQIPALKRFFARQAMGLGQISSLKTDLLAG
jgi:2-octaprenyl-6-methoxyphenol hydroxylase